MILKKKTFHCLNFEIWKECPAAQPQGFLMKLLPEAALRAADYAKEQVWCPGQNSEDFQIFWKSHPSFSFFLGGGPIFPFGSSALFSEAHKDAADLAAKAIAAAKAVEVRRFGFQKIWFGRGRGRPGLGDFTVVTIAGMIEGWEQVMLLILNSLHRV